MASSTGIACGDTKIVSPKGIHKATIVWLHDIGEKGRDSAIFVRQLNLPTVKWICPTAPRRPVTSLGGTQTTAWSDVTGVSENMEDDMVSLNSIAAFVVNLLQDEPNNVMIGLGGIGLGASVALYLATCYITGWQQTIRLRAIVGINGWLPAWRNLRQNMSFNYGTPSLAPSVPILLTHGTSDAIVPLSVGNRCRDTLHRAGFPVTFTPYEGNHHATVPQVINVVRMWLTTNFQL
ncbi:acyl-protein thioesterase 2 isoform X2 [Capsella rubella]|uniref:acyl-protein thioesterase 2 isoform X2 n=1 Tax=Capsella rubella TaxID=81985 RepID=UPI000CD53107|nr:acyl-protein thioesterase 2 isoform X2 [Capsella rubella]